MIFIYRELIDGQMEENMKVNGKIITCMDVEYIFGVMEESMRDNIKMIKNMVMECINGTMVEYLRVIGKMVSSMDLGSLRNLTVMNSNLDYGRKEQEYNGLMMNQYFCL